MKTVNYNHLMPTRYTLDLDLKACACSYICAADVQALVCAAMFV